ncbi:protein COBRA [Trifolium repens]|nr:protein COBRA [Trifolium repens]
MRLCFSFLCVLVISSYAVAYDPKDPNGNITIKWDVIAWTPDGYVAMVTINNFQKFRQIKNPGWRLGWTWAKKEVIWDMLGAQTTEQGDCSRFKGNIPHSCKKIPTVVDLLPSVSYYRQVPNCCKGGVVAALGQSAFEASIGQAGNTTKTVRIPQNFTLLAPRARYTCRPAKIIPSTVYITPDRRRTTRALMTWDAICKYAKG